MKNKFAAISLNFIAFMLFAFAGLILYWAIYPVDVIDHYVLVNDEFVEQTEQPYSFKTSTDTVKKGEELEVTFYYQKYYPVDGDTIRALICGDNLVTLSTIDTDLPTTEGITKVVASVEIPEKTSDGICYLTYTTRRRLNPLRTYTETFRSNDFNVIE